jgi:hypothetical protein
MTARGRNAAASAASGSPTVTVAAAAGRGQARDVLHHPPAAAHHPAVAGGEHHFQEPVAGRPVIQAPPAAGTGRHHAADRGVAGDLRQHGALSPDIELGLEVGHPRPGANDDGQVVRTPVGDPLQPGGAHGDVGGDGMPEISVGTTSTEPDLVAFGGRGIDRGGCLLRSLGNQRLGGHGHAAGCSDGGGRP